MMSFPSSLGDELSAGKSAFRKKVFESGIKGVFRPAPDTSETHRPATPCVVFTRFSRCYLFRDISENMRLETEFP